MILVTLGTQDKSFVRLLEAIENEIDKGNIKSDVIVQAGCTKFKSKYMKILDLIPVDKFDNYVEKCDILITHGGVGSIITGLKKNKIVIAAPRLAKYNEHINDHQMQIVDNFSKSGYIIPLYDFDKLDEAMKKASKFKPKKYKSNTSSMIKLLENYINNN